MVRTTQEGVGVGLEGKDGRDYTRGGRDGLEGNDGRDYTTGG